jgi:type I restriction enzyme S subunit
MQKNKNRVGYKKTKVGWIPQAWDCLRLKACSNKIGSGITPKGGDAVYVEHGIPFIRSQNVLAGQFSEVGLKYITEHQHGLMKSSALQPNDVLFNITGASIGRSCLLPINLNTANLNQHVCIIRLKDQFDPKLYSSILNSVIAKKQLYENQAGGGREGLNFANLGNFQVPAPPLPEQKAIADVLNSWDHGIRKLEAKLATKRRIKKGLMQELLSGQRRVAGFGPDLKVQEGACSIPEGWKSVKLANIVDLQYGKDWKTVVDPSGQFNVFGTGGLMGKSTRALFSAPAIILGRKGTIDKPFYVTAPFWAVDTTFVIHPRGQNILKFLYFKFLTINWKNYSEASGVPSLSRPTLQQIKVILPPVEEQQAIVKILNAADRELDALERKLSNWKAQKKYLLNNLVDGTIRLPQFINAETC